MDSQHRHLIIVAGEASGDMHATSLMDALRRLIPGVTFSGLGGPRMRAAGATIFRDLTELAVVGFWEVLRHYREIREAFDLIIKKIENEKPDAVILVDYPGFNLRLARALKKRGIKIIYYISPQVWAWKANRVHFIKTYVDRMLVLFQFEKDFYARFGIDVAFVGHPLIDAVKVTTPKDEFLRAIQLSHQKLTIGLLPGSRQREVENLLPVMLKAAGILQNTFPRIQFMIIKAPTITEALLRKHAQKAPIPCPVITEHGYDGINACDLCIVASGTATLETAILQKPMIVVYKTSLLTWLLARVVIKIKHIGLVNVVAGRRIVPERVQFQATGEQIARDIRGIITDEIKIADIKSSLQTVKKSLGPPGANEKAAQEILNQL